MQPFTPEDLYLHHTLTGLHCAPGGDPAVAAVRTVDRRIIGWDSPNAAQALPRRPGGPAGPRQAA